MPNPTYLHPNLLNVKMEEDVSSLENNENEFYSFDDKNFKKDIGNLCDELKKNQSNK
jgi:hypothetical protein